MTPRKQPEALPSGEQKRLAVRSMFDRISGNYDRVNRVMALGMDMRWRRRAVKSMGLPVNSRIIDIACGTGDFCRLAQEAGLRPIGLDLSLGMLTHAQTTAPLIEADGLATPFRDVSVDGITCGFGLRNVIDIQALFQECSRILRPGGRVAFLEVSEPSNKLLRFGNRIYFHRIVPAIAGAIVDREAYHYLPRSLAYLPDERTLADMLQQSGFINVEQEAVGAGSARIITATRS